METKQLKEYLKAVLELEGALYKNEKATTEYARQRNENSPKAPQQIHVAKPNKPAGPEPLSSSLNGKVAFLYGFLTVFFFVVLCCTDIDSFLFPLFLIAGLGTLLWTIMSICSSRKYKKDCSAYQDALKIYNGKMKKYEKDIVIVHNEYNAQMRLHREQESAYFAETTKNSEEFDELTVKLKNALSQMYAMDLIYPKYQNIVAVATIYEYIDSGRCSELTGSNGAYNLYESELRANLIIGSLSQINQNLQSIRENQFALYALIEESNRSVTQLLDKIYNEQAKTAYFTQTIASISQANLMLNALKD